VLQGAIIIADASGAFCHLVHRAGRSSHLQLRPHIVNKVSELGALQPAGARASLPRGSAHAAV